MEIDSFTINEAAKSVRNKRKNTQTKRIVLYIQIRKLSAANGNYLYFKFSVQYLLIAGVVVDSML